MTERVLARNGVELHWWERGDGHATVVFTHGGAMDHRLWDPQTNEFAASHRCITHDVRGHGASSCSGAEFSLEAAADDLLEILEASGTGKATLVGHSFGATICQLVALKAPERVAGLVCISGACVTLPFSLPARLRAAVGPLALRALGQDRTRAMFAEQAGMEPSTQAYAREAISAVSKDVFEAIMRTGFGRTVDVPQDYRVGVPLLLLQGEKEPNPLLVANARAWAARDGGRFTIVPGAAHNAGQDAPDFVNGEMARLLARIAGTPEAAEGSAA